MAEPIEMTREDLGNMIAAAVKEAVGEAPKAQPTDLIIPTGNEKAEIRSMNKEEVGLGLGRVMRALAATKGNGQAAMHWMRDMWGTGDNDPAQKILVVGSDTAGGFLVPEILSDIWLELLEPFSVFLPMGPVTIPFESGNTKMNGLATGATAYYLGEIDAITPSEVSFRSISLSAKQLAALVPISNFLLRTGSPSVDGIVRDAMLSAMALRQDLAFIRGDGVSDTPIGLLNLGTQTAMTATPTLATTASDLANAVYRMRVANADMSKLGWFMHPRTELWLKELRESGTSWFPYRDEVEAGRLLGYPIGVTTQIPINLGGGTESELYLTNFNNVYVGDTFGVEMSVSSEASYVDGATTHSAFQKNLTLMKTIAAHDMDIPHVHASQIITGLTWGA